MIGVAGSSKTAPRIFFFSIVLGAEYSFYVKSIATYAPTFLGHNSSVLAIVQRLVPGYPSMDHTYACSENDLDLIQTLEERRH